MASIINGLFAGQSGIASQGTAIAVLGDNIANSNTTGFKASRADFTDLLAGNLGGAGGGLAVGSGSEVKAVTSIFTQGTLDFTGRGLDNAIDGNGFFVVQDSSGARYYTRAGNFNVDADGNLQDQNGDSVVGFPNSSGGLAPINVRNFTQTNISTQNVTFTGNVDASAAGSDPAAFPAAPTTDQLNSLADFQTNTDVFDGLGGKHSATVYFFKDNTYVPTPAQTAAGQVTKWDVRAYVDGADVKGGTAGTPVQLGATATMTFGSDGTQTTPSTIAPIISAATLAGGAAWANGSPSSGAGGTPININGQFTQFDNTSLVNSVSQDGKGAGNVVSFSVQPDGTLFAQMDNGTTTSIGKLALANFANPEGLERKGSSLFEQSNASGEPVIGTPKTGQFGAIQSGALELSTSDIAADFVKLITLQRGFQGSSRIITSINDLLNDVINLVR